MNAKKVPVSQIATCRLCDRTAKLIKAHAIPEAFFRVLREDGETPTLITGDARQHRKRAPIGVYDQRILCASCESTFSRMDDYAVETLLTRFDDCFAEVRFAGNLVGYVGVETDQRLLLRFLVATLWRASVSTQPFYQRVRLARYEGLAKSAILHVERDVPHFFSALISKWDPTDELPADDLRHVIQDPFPERWCGVNAYRLYLGEVVAYVKVDRRPFPPDLRQFALVEQDSLIIVLRSLKNSHDFAAMASTAMRAHANEQRRRSRATTR